MRPEFLKRMRNQDKETGEIYSGWCNLSGKYDCVYFTSWRCSGYIQPGEYAWQDIVLERCRERFVDAVLAPEAVYESKKQICSAYDMAERLVKELER